MLAATVRYIRTIGLKPAGCSCLTNCMAPQAIALESCSNPEDSASFQIRNENKFFGFTLRIF